MTELTNEQLYRFHIEIQQLQRTSAIGFLLKGRINDFYKENNIRIQTLVEKLQQIQKDNLVCDANGMPKFNDKKEAELLEGCTMEEFNRLTKEVMDRKVAVNL